MPEQRALEALGNAAVAQPGARRNWPGLSAACARAWTRVRPRDSQQAAFWLACAALLAAAAWLRCWRLDMPPFDFPADRQRTNVNIMQLLREGTSLFGARQFLFELPLLPWLAVRTAWLGRLFGLELITWARVWAMLFGLATVALAAPAGWWSAGAGANLGRRRRLALLFMAAMAFNPFHIYLSRLLITEPVTLAFQMAALACFWIACDRAQTGTRTGMGTRTARWAVLFILCYIMACWAKIPALLWAPAYALALLAGGPLRATLSGRARARWAVGLGLAALAGLAAMFWLMRINPLRFGQAFSERFPYHAGQIELWIGHPHWTRTWAHRVLLMLTLPGTALAVIGLFRAPWLYRIAMLGAATGFYIMVNLNYYNFCHLIIPGMALAAWGADLLLESAVPAREDAGARRPWRRRLGFAAAAVALLLGVRLLYPLGPELPHPVMPRAEVTQALAVIGRLVPPRTTVVNDDVMEGSISNMLGQPYDTARTELDLHTGWFYAITRFGERPLAWAAQSWVRWASLPGEANGLLFAPAPPQRKAASGAAMIELPLADAAATTGTAPAAAGPESLARALSLPRESFNPGSRVLSVAPGTSFTLGIAWRKGAAPGLASVAWRSQTWHQPLPVPVREGGFSIYRGGVLCQPAGPDATGWYTFELPADFPPGEYRMELGPQAPGVWRAPNAQPLPLTIEVYQPRGVDPEQRAASDEPAADFAVAGFDAAPRPIARPWIALWPFNQVGPPLAWREARTFAAMRLVGYKFIDDQDFLLACPGSPAGEYELAVTGEGTPVSDPNEPGDRWPVIEVIPAENFSRLAAELRLAWREPRETATRFVAWAPFDSLWLRVRLAKAGAQAPPWNMYFQPGSFGRQVVTLREVRLTPRRSLFEARNDPATSSAGTSQE